MTLKKRHFTLIELLVVMGLIGLLVSLAVPSFTRLAKGKAVPAAADQIKRQLEEAQALAIANRSYVGLIIVNSSKTGTSDTATTNYNFDNDSDDLKSNPTLYRLASTRPAMLFKDASDYFFEKWAPGSSWSTPTENARIVKIVNSQSSLPASGGELTDISIPLAAVGAFQNVTQENNRLTSPCAVIFSPDGGLAANSDLYLVIAGGTLTNNTMTLNSDGADYMVLHINRMNGRISYYERQ